MIKTFVNIAIARAWGIIRILQASETLAHPALPGLSIRLDEI